MDGTGDHHVYHDKPSSKGQITRFLTFVESRPKITMMIIVTIMGYECI
jgi:hypothetical protein